MKTKQEWTEYFSWKGNAGKIISGHVVLDDEIVSAIQKDALKDLEAKILTARQSAYDECAEIIDKRAACMTVLDEFIDRLRDAILAAKKELK